jgi:SAM-dependent methyltransferase
MGAVPSAAHEAGVRALVDAASAPYRSISSFAYHFARGKLRGDPVYRAMLEFGLLSGRAQILDLGCGQGLLAAWLVGAQHCYDRGEWPGGWPAPPRPRAIRGIELMPREVARAQCGLGAGIEIVQGDIRAAEFGSVDAVVILDVLHYLDAESQREVLHRVRAALPPHGLLLLRVADADGGWRFRYTRAIDQSVVWLRRYQTAGHHWRPLAEWREQLAACGFTSEVRPMSRGTPFANVLLAASAV